MISISFSIFKVTGARLKLQDIGSEMQKIKQVAHGLVSLFCNILIRILDAGFLVCGLLLC